MKKPWFQKDYRRNLVDMHITDLKDDFLAEFDPVKYVETIVSSNANYLLFYACSHIGFCHWPTASGSAHPNLKGRDFVGDVIHEAHRRGLDVGLYFSLIFNNWAADNHPDWVMRKSNGEQIFGLGSRRYKVCCMNNQDYRNYVREQLEELCASYRFEGFWMDMTFWPGFCYCKACRDRYRNEVGAELPTVINWQNSEWLRFQRKREEWMSDFAGFVSSAVKSNNPNITVTHQGVSYMMGWSSGANVEFSDHTDFMAADMYGDRLYQSYYSKLFYSLSKNHPFEYMTSRCSSLFNHTLSKPAVELEVYAFASIANGGAFLFIDAIDPQGTLNPRIYADMAPVYEKLARVEKYVGGEMTYDVAVYHSTTSRMPMLQSGEADTYNTSNSMDMDVGISKDLQPDVIACMPAALSFSPTNHVKASWGIVKTLMTNHLPFGIITNKNLSQLSKIKLLILPEVACLDEGEIAAIKDYVKNGGNILATRITSLYKPNEMGTNFSLEDVLGVSFHGMQDSIISYISPSGEGASILFPYTKGHPLCILFDKQTKVKVKEGAKILGNFTASYSDFFDFNRFASIHSNPPSKETDEPSIVLNHYGKGKSLYITANLNLSYPELQGVFMNMVNVLLPEKKQLQTNAPGAVEITVFRKKEENRCLVHLVNFQELLPNIPVYDIQIRLRLETAPGKVLRLPEEEEICFSYEDGYLGFHVSRLETYALYAIDFSEDRGGGLL
mgnify:CR=1 FL=1